MSKEIENNVKEILLLQDLGGDCVALSEEKSKAYIKGREHYDERLHVSLYPFGVFVSIPDIGSITIPISSDPEKYTSANFELDSSATFDKLANINELVDKAVLLGKEVIYAVKKANADRSRDGDCLREVLGQIEKHYDSCVGKDLVQVEEDHF